MIWWTFFKLIKHRRQIYSFRVEILVKELDGTLQEMRHCGPWHRQKATALRERPPSRRHGPSRTPRPRWAQPPPRAACQWPGARSGPIWPKAGRHATTTCQSVQGPHRQSSMPQPVGATHPVRQTMAQRQQVRNALIRLIHAQPPYGAKSPARSGSPPHGQCPQAQQLHRRRPRDLPPNMDPSCSHA